MNARPGRNVVLHQNIAQAIGNDSLAVRVDHFTLEKDFRLSRLQRGCVFDDLDFGVFVCRGIKGISEGGRTTIPQEIMPGL